MDYILGFSKINNEDRFKPDVPGMEASFNRTARASKLRYEQRIKYLFPREVDEVVFERHLEALDSMIDLFQSKGIEVIAMQTPVPKGFYELMPGEEEFTEQMAAWLEKRGVTFYDFSSVANDDSYFYDTDHLNKKGTLAFYNEYLADVLVRHAQN